MSNLAEDDKWKILEPNYLIKWSWLTARKDNVQLPEKDEFVKLVREYLNSVNVIAITKDGQLVMVRQYRHTVGVTCYDFMYIMMDESDFGGCETGTD